MANKQISDLQARTFDGDSIIAHDVENTDPSTMSQKPYLTGSATGHAVADFVGNGEIYTTDLDTVDKHINGAINELHTINGYSYDAYDDTATYSVGDLCIYNNALYKCTTAITTAEAWNASHWTATSIADEISALNTDKADKDNIIIRYVQLFGIVNVAADSEYNSDGSTIPHVTPPVVSGYSVLDVCNVRARGYYGSRGVLYAWYDSADNKIKFSLYNASNRNDATFIGDCWLIYRKN